MPSRSSHACATSRVRHHFDAPVRQLVDRVVHIHVLRVGVVPGAVEGLFNQPSEVASLFARVVL
eukprot:6252485-Pyramimonas_sp.AAC.1